MKIGYQFEIGFLILLFLGVIFSFLMQNFFMHLATIFIFGLIAATLQELKKFDLNFPYVLLIIGFVVGYLIATKSGLRFWMLVIFVLGLIAGNFSKKYLREYLGSSI